MVKDMKVEKGKWYRRGVDYPAYASKEHGSAKMSIALKGDELLTWFTEEELKDYPKLNAYAGSLP